MAAGDKIAGKRLPDDTLPHELEPGEYSLARDGHSVWLCSPRGEPGHVTSPTWSIKIEEDDTITIDPSIFWDKNNTPPGWHGYLIKGEWQEV